MKFSQNEKVSGMQRGHGLLCIGGHVRSLGMTRDECPLPLDVLREQLDLTDKGMWVAIRKRSGRAVILGLGRFMRIQTPKHEETN